MVLNQKGRCIVGSGGVQINDASFFFAAHYPIGSAQAFSVRRHVECHAGKEKFPHTTGIGHMAEHFFSCHFCMAYKAVEPVQKFSFHQFFIYSFHDLQKRPAPAGLFPFSFYTLKRK